MHTSTAPTTPFSSYRASTSEPYGGVSFARKRTPSHAFPPPPLTHAAPGPRRRPSSVTKNLTTSPVSLPEASHTYPNSAEEEVHIRFLHNVPIGCLLIPPLALLLTLSSSSAPSNSMLLICAAVYCLDLTNSRDGCVSVIWMGFVCLSICLSVELWDDEAVRVEFVTVLLPRLGVEILLVLCVTCWSTLQFPWLALEIPDFAKTLEGVLCFLAPPTFASLMTYFFVATISERLPSDLAAGCFSFLLLFFLAAALKAVTGLPSSYLNLETGDDGVGRVVEKTQGSGGVFPARHGLLLSLMLLGSPLLAHISIMHNRIFFQIPSLGDATDLCLIFSLSVLTHETLFRTSPWRDRLQYKRISEKLIRLTVPCAILAALCLQSRFGVSFCNSVSSLFHTATPSPSIVTVLLFLSSILAVFAYWTDLTLKTQHVREGDFSQGFFGEYTEDAFQFSVVGAAFLMGLALGMPWRATPVFILSVLSFVLFMSFRLLRYMASFTAVMTLSLLNVVLYRFGYLSVTLDNGLSLWKFSILIVVSVSLLGMFVGTAHRAPGGYGSKLNLDLPGLLLLAYSFLLAFLECSLGGLRTDPDTPHEDSLMEESLYVYWTYYPLLTSLILVGIAMYLKQCGRMSHMLAILVSCISTVKAVVLLLPGNRHSGLYGSVVMLFIAWMLFLVPYAFLEPIVLSKRFKIGAAVGAVPKRAKMVMLGYNLLILPLFILVTTVIVIQPMLEHYFSTLDDFPLLPLSQTVAWSCTLWGFSSLSMLTYYTPQNTAQGMKKTAVVLLFLGIFTVLASPSLPRFASDPPGQNHTPETLLHLAGSGGWGIISAGTACLLALTGPLSLERKSRTDLGLLPRLTVFSVMFGCGMAWFVILRLTPSRTPLSLTTVGVSSMVMAFLGTVAVVTGRSVHLEDFRDADRAIRLWFVAFVPMGILSSVSAFSDNSRAFGAGGWLSTYLIICSCVLGAFGLTVKTRTDKNSVTRGVANMAAILSWSLGVIVIYGCFGLAGIGLEGSSSGVRSWASVVGTLTISPILLILEGESSHDKITRTYRLSSRSTPHAPSPITGINLPSLSRSDRFAPPAAATALVFLLASLYAIFVRGCGVADVASVDGPHATHGHVFESVYGTATRTTAGLASGMGDVEFMAGKRAAHAELLVTAARLAGIGLCTARGYFGPLLHLTGVGCVLPSLVSAVRYVWTESRQHLMKVIALLPLNLIPLFFCRGVSSLRALAVLSFLGGMFQIFSMRRARWRGKMSI